MKKFIFSFLLNIFILSFVFSMFSGIKLPGDFWYVCLIYSSLSLGIMLQKPLLKFLTVKNNILTYWISASLISLGVFYLLVTFLPGFSVTVSVVQKINYGLITVDSFKLDTMLTIISCVLLASLFSGIMEMLKKPTEE